MWDFCFWKLIVVKNKNRSVLWLWKWIFLIALRDMTTLNSRVCTLIHICIKNNLYKSIEHVSTNIQYIFSMSHQFVLKQWKMKKTVLSSIQSKKHMANLHKSTQWTWVHTPFVLNTRLMTLYSCWAADSHQSREREKQPYDCVVEIDKRETSAAAIAHFRNRVIYQLIEYLGISLSGTNN